MNHVARSFRAPPFSLGLTADEHRESMNNTAIEGKTSFTMDLSR